MLIMQNVRKWKPVCNSIIIGVVKMRNDLKWTAQEKK